MDEFEHVAAAADDGVAAEIKDAASQGAVSVKDQLLVHLEENLGEDAWHKAVELIDDMPALLKHLEAQLPMVHFGVVQKLLGLEL